MADLTPEERQRIYLEEKVRLEARREIESKRVGPGKIILYVFLALFGLLIIFSISDSVSESRQTPKERAKQRAEGCLHEWQVKLSEQGYSYEEGKTGAFLHCSAEIEKLDDFGK